MTLLAVLAIVGPIVGLIVTAALLEFGQAIRAVNELLDHVDRMLTDPEPTVLPFYREDGGVDIVHFPPGVWGGQG